MIASLGMTRFVFFRIRTHFLGLVAGLVAGLDHYG